MQRSLITSLRAAHSVRKATRSKSLRRLTVMTYSSFKYKVHGKVQGVFFRAGTIDEAKRLGLVGHVENNPDSTVTGEAQGNAQAIAKLKQWLQHTGPPGATIQKCDITDEKDDLESLSYSSFEKH